MLRRRSAQGSLASGIAEATLKHPRTTRMMLFAQLFLTEPSTSASSYALSGTSAVRWMVDAEQGLQTLHGS
eukprot:scaffold215815_cov18-Tisochrysis_lutea.AAC.1